MPADSVKRYTWLLLLAPLAAITWWLQNLVEPISPVVDRKAGHTADYSMETFMVTETNISGLPHYRLNASFMEHYADDGSAYLRKPRIQFFSPEKAPWTLNADEGTVSADNKLIWLRGKVLIERAETPLQGPLQLTTRDVLVRPHDQYAETSEHVMIEDTLSTTRAVGLRMLLKDERLQLLSQVQGRYASH